MTDVRVRVVVWVRAVYSKTREYGLYSAFSLHSLTSTTCSRGHVIELYVKDRERQWKDLGRSTLEIGNLTLNLSHFE